MNHRRRIYFYIYLFIYVATTKVTFLNDYACCYPNIYEIFFRV